MADQSSQCAARAASSDHKLSNDLGWLPPDSFYSRCRGYARGKIYQAVIGPARHFLTKGTAVAGYSLATRQSAYTHLHRLCAES